MRPAIWHLELMDEVSSTQDAASRLAEGGAPEGVVVVAKAQTAGRGRSGRRWDSPVGGLYMSLVLRPSNSAQPQLLSLVGAFSVVLGIESATGLKSSVRWPNDVLIRGRKVSGVLAEASYSGKTLSYVVLGIGLNCNSRTSSLEGTQGTATSLLEELGRPVEVTNVRERILDEFRLVYTRWLDGADILKDAERFVGTLGKQVVAKAKSGAELSCTALELESTGGLVVLNQGKKVVLHAEDLEWLREEL